MNKNLKESTTIPLLLLVSLTLVFASLCICRPVRNEKFKAVNNHRSRLNMISKLKPKY